MNRLARLALAVAVSISSGLALAQSLSVTEIQQQIDQKQDEFNNFNQRVTSEANLANGLETDLEALRENGALADADRQSALINMNLQYEKMIDDPELDISFAQNEYAKAVRTHKDIKEAITVKYNEWQAKLRDVDQLKVSKHALLNSLEGLKEQLNGARVDRVYREFNRKDNVVVSHNIACDKEETIAKCIDRGKGLAKQKASKRFLDFLYDGLSDSVEAEQRRANSDAYVQVLRSDVTDSNFSGQGNFNVRMNLELQGNLKRKEACDLLGLDLRYCREIGAAMNELAAADEPARAVATDESAMYELTVRSNVYDDEVFIDGVSYGSTRLQVMLPSGEHDIEVVKRGYEPFRETVELNEPMTLRVQLEKAQYSFSKGERIQDILSGDLPGPDLVVVPAGNFRMGDISGQGLDNERPVTTQEISYSYGVGEHEVTVAEFTQFVEATSHVTEAEKSLGCANSAAEFDEQLNWRSPGFEQSEENPVVCVSISDAQAYVDWLSSSSGQSYRLPSEVEWEYAARGGKENDYWWGDGVGTDNANCGWCGSQWSNVSSSPVAAFERNDFGLFDTVGNVWEWTEGNSERASAIVRGGSWNFAPRLARVSTRMELDPIFRSNYIGFRVLREQ